MPFASLPRVALLLLSLASVASYSSGTNFGCTSTPGHGSSSSSLGFTLGLYDEPVGGASVTTFEPGGKYYLQLRTASASIRGFLLYATSGAGSVEAVSGDAAAQTRNDCPAGTSAVTHVSSLVKSIASAAWTAPAGAAPGATLTLRAFGVASQASYSALQLTVTAGAAASGTGTPSASPSGTPTPSAPATPSPTPSAPATPSPSPSPTPSPTATLSPGASPTATPSPPPTPPRTPSPAPSPSPAPPPPPPCAAGGAAPAPGALPCAPAYAFAAPLAPSLTLEWALVQRAAPAQPARAAARSDPGANATAAAAAAGARLLQPAAATTTWLVARLNCSTPGAWAALAVNTAPNSMAGGDAIVLQPGAGAGGGAVSQAVLGAGYSLAAVAAIPASAATLDASASSLAYLSPSGALSAAPGAAAAAVGWSATFARPLARGAYAGALPLSASGSSIVTVAWGRAGQGTLAGGHAPGAYASLDLDLATGAASARPPAPTRALYAAHGALMVAAWTLLLPAGAAGARWGRAWIAPVFGGWHSRVAGAGWVLLLGGFAAAVAAVALTPGKAHFGASAHSALGLAVFLLGALQPLNACCRPTAAAASAGAACSARAAWGWVHRGGGWVAILVLAPAATVLGLARPAAAVPWQAAAAYYAALAAMLGALAWLGGGECLRSGGGGVLSSGKGGASGAGGAAGAGGGAGAGAGAGVPVGAAAVHVLGGQQHLASFR